MFSVQEQVAETKRFDVESLYTNTPIDLAIELISIKSIKYI